MDMVIIYANNRIVVTICENSIYLKFDQDVMNGVCQ